MNNFFDLVKSRQACREFNDKPIERETLEKIMEMARLTPSACNSQPWQVYCVSNKENMDKIYDACTEKGKNKFLDKAKAYFVLVEKGATLKEDVKNAYGEGHFVKYDIGALTSYITLSAKSLGVDSCIIGWINHDKLKSALSLNENDVCNIIVAVGYSNIATREKVRKPIGEIVDYL